MKHHLFYPHQIIAGICLVILMPLFSCKKAVTVDFPSNYLVAGAVFTSDKSAVSAISGLYSQMASGNLTFAGNGFTVFTGMSVDELQNTTTGSHDEFSDNHLSASNAVVLSNFWAAGYKYIYQCNAIIKGLQESTGLTPAVKDQLLGEAMFVRAFCYFYLANLFGDVPLVLSTDFRVNALLPRAPVGQIYDQVIADLHSASPLLDVLYPSAGRVRPNRWAARALLARVYLYLKNYDQAEAVSSEVIHSGTYSLVTNLQQVFLSGSNEAIWQIAPVQPNFNTWDGNLFISNAGVVPSFMATHLLLAAFEATDQRKGAWLKGTTVNSVTYHYPFKYKVKTAATVTEHLIMLRFAELFLIRAEARIFQGNITGAQADLDKIRNRAGLMNTVASTSDEIKTAILHERRLEFFAEWGHRWFDLKRSGDIDNIMNAAKPGQWQPYDALYPIPFLEIQKNSFLIQNPGY